MTTHALTTVEFHGDVLWASEVDGEIYVAIKPICQHLGIAWHGQFERIKRNSVLAEGTRIIRIPSAGGMQEATLLRLDLLNGWLFGIDESRVKDEDTRQQVLTYKRECYRVLYEHFFERAQAQEEADTGPRTLMPGDADFAQAARLVREARLSRGKEAALALWRQLGLPWVPEMDGAAGAAPFNEELQRFLAECVVSEPGVDVPARTMYQAYVSWAEAKGQRQATETRFGREIKKRLAHGTTSRNTALYRNVRLVNVPRPENIRPAQ